MGAGEVTPTTLSSRDSAVDRRQCDRSCLRNAPRRKEPEDALGRVIASWTSARNVDQIEADLQGTGSQRIG
jgi:hypothetical protein